MMFCVRCMQYYTCTTIEFESAFSYVFFIHVCYHVSIFIRSGSKSIKAKRNNLQSVQFSVLCIYIYNLLASAKTTMLSLNTPRATRGTERTANTYINCTLTIASW